MIKYCVALCGLAIPLGSRWFMFGVSLRTVCVSSGSWQILACVGRSGMAHIYKCSRGWRDIWNDLLDPMVSFEVTCYVACCRLF